MTRLICAALAFAAVDLGAQQPPPPAAPPVTPAFEVVVIKRNTSGDDSMSVGSRPGGGYVMVNGPMRSVFGNAYPSQSSNVINMPDWFDSERYDLTARIVGNPTAAQRLELWRNLFTERMKLRVHYETRDLPTFDLVVARADGRLGPDIRPAQIDCAARSAAAARGQALPPLPPPAPNAAPVCGMIAGPEGIRAGGTTMAGLARSISGSAGRLIIDKTGLTGSYDLTLLYASGRPGTSTVADDRPTIFTALQEQLGLKLESSRSPVEHAVIDYVEKPIVD
jgi:uncharacterized protein (TIGR03435 family)